MMMMMMTMMMMMLVIMMMLDPVDFRRNESLTRGTTALQLS